MFIEELRMYRKTKLLPVTLEEHSTWFQGFFLITMKFHLFVSVLGCRNKIYR